MPTLDSAVNGRDNLTALASGQTQPGRRVMVFTYKGNECGVAVDLSGTGVDQSNAASAVFINRGPKMPKGNFTSMLTTTNDGGGVDEIITGAETLSAMVHGKTNATFGEGLALTADSGAEIVRTDVTGAPNGNYPTQPEVMAKRFNYSLNAEDWAQLSQQQQLDAIAQFFTDNADVCHEKAVTGTAKAYKTGKFIPTKDGVQTTLWLACVYFQTGVNTTAGEAPPTPTSGPTQAATTASTTPNVIVESGGWNPGEQTS